MKYECFFRDSLAFATEPVLGSLANVLGDYTNMQLPVSSFIKDYKLEIVEIKYGLIQVCQIYMIYANISGFFLASRLF